MTAYCTEKLAGNAHTCLCTAIAHHIGGHLCACGHTWGDPWHTMTYDQQRAWLGLPAPPIKEEFMARIRYAIQSGALDWVPAALKELEERRNRKETS